MSLPIDLPLLVQEGLGRARSALFRRIAPLHGGEAFSPFFIVGSGRSGNTLLRRMLMASSAIHIPPENYGLGRAIVHFARNATMPWRPLVSSTLAIIEHAEDFESFGFSLAPLAREAASWDPRRRSLAKLIDLIYRRHAQSIGRMPIVWGDKTPLNTFFLPKIARVFPEATFIHMLRDGLDAIYSYVESGLIPELDNAARRWVESVNAVQRFAAKNRVIELRYERLAKTPEPELRRICEAIKVSFSMDMVNSTGHVAKMGDVPRHAHHAAVAQPLFDSAIGKGRRHLTAEDKRRIAPIVDATLIRMGYAPAEFGPSAAERPAPPPSKVPVEIRLAAGAYDFQI